MNVVTKSRKPNAKPEEKISRPRGRPRKHAKPIEVIPPEPVEAEPKPQAPVKRRGGRRSNSLPPIMREGSSLVARKPLIEMEAEERDRGEFREGTKRKPIIITRPSFDTGIVVIRGTTPLVLHRFSEKVRDSIRATQEEGQRSKKGKSRIARDFEDLWQAARHKSRSGWDGIPSSAFRNALISACRTVGFKMTIAKMSLFCVADGYDSSGTGLVKITKGEPFCDIRPGRNAYGGIDLRARPMWNKDWEAVVTLRWDTDQFSATDVMNLMARAGQQVGVGEGRPDSKLSAGCGWGEFEVVGYQAP